MDINYLYHRHGVSLFMAKSAACEQSRAAHLGLLAGYAERIATTRADRYRPRLELVA